MVVSAIFHYYYFKLLDICLEEVVIGVNVLGLRRYLRYCVKFKTSAVIFVDDALGDCFKSSVDLTIFSMHLRSFDDYVVDLLKQFTDTNRVTHVCQQGDILGFGGT